MNVAPDSSAVRTALWRALHVELDDPPHLLEDEIGLALAAPEDDWRTRPDMHPSGTLPYRGAIVARTRFVEDLLVDEGIGQYVLLGAGLDTFAQRHPEVADVTVFEVDQPGPQAWKRQRLEVLGYGVRPRLVPVDFDADDDWWLGLIDAGFDATAPAVVSSSGVSMYITKAATAGTLRRLATMAPGSVLAMTFMLPFELVDEADRSGLWAHRAVHCPRAHRGSASTRRERSWRSRRGPASPTSATSRPPSWPSATSPGGPTASGPPAARASS